MVTRYGSRVELTCKAILAGEHSFCEGQVLDVSLPGCLVECVHSFRVGDYVQLQIFLPDQALPMNIGLAAVRWADSTRVGLEFIRSTREDQLRLAKLVKHRLPSWLLA